MQLVFCLIGLVLLIASVILCCIQHDRVGLWFGMLMVGEIFAWVGAIPILSKFF